MRACLLALVVLPGLAAAAPRTGSLDADLARIRDTESWFFRETFLGWTANHRAVFRTAVCDPDDGGGRGSYCDVYLCVAEAMDAKVEERAMRGDCTDVVRLDIDEGAARSTLDVAAARRTERRLLAKLGTLAPGRALPASSFRPAIAKKQLSLARGGKAGKGTIELMTWDVSMSEREPSVDKVTVTPAPPDGPRVAPIGHFRFRSDYEGVPTRTPVFFGVVRCR
jgi:hypothetical protein